jgi:hypothetical protein
VVIETFLVRRVTLPAIQSTEDVELNEEQLDIVSGGLNGDLIVKP